MCKVYILAANLYYSYLNFSDTDSFAFRIPSTNLSNEFKKIKSVLDFSKYELDHELFNVKNKRRSGYFKDESGKFVTPLNSSF